MSSDKHIGMRVTRDFRPDKEERTRNAEQSNQDNNLSLQPVVLIISLCRDLKN